MLEVQFLSVAGKKNCFRVRLSSQGKLFLAQDWIRSGVFPVLALDSFCSICSCKNWFATGEVKTHRYHGDPQPGNQQMDQSLPDQVSIPDFNRRKGKQSGGRSHQASETSKNATAVILPRLIRSKPLEHQRTSNRMPANGINSRLSR